MKTLLGLLHVHKNIHERRIHTACNPREKSSLRRVKQGKTVSASLPLLSYKSICKHSYSGEICKWDIIHWKAVACEEPFIFTNRCFWKFYLAIRSFCNLHANWLSSTVSTWRHANHPSSESPGSAGLRSATGLKSKLAHWNCGLLCSEHWNDSCPLWPSRAELAGQAPLCFQLRQICWVPRLKSS